MRPLLPTARSFLIQSGQAVSLAGVAVLAMAAAPLTSPRDGAPVETLAAPEAPPLAAVAEPAGPVRRLITFGMPVRHHAINSPFGLRRLPGNVARNHEGVDIAAPSVPVSLPPRRVRSCAPAMTPPAMGALSRFATRTA